MLLACRDCHRVYDVKELAVGKKVRCACGCVNEVAEAAPVERVMAHCGSCGGAIAADAKACAYCQARVTLLEEKLGGPCPFCATRLAAEARFCHGCGRNVEAEAGLQALSDSACPHCREPLQVFAGMLDPFHQCGTCGGMWLSRRALERFAEDARSAPATSAERGEVDRTVRIGRRTRSGPSPLRCPVCSRQLVRHEFARYSGVQIDQCQAHGCWFDEHELAAIGKFLRAGGPEAVELRERSRRRSKAVARAWRQRVAAQQHDPEGFLWLLTLLAD